MAVSVELIGTNTGDVLAGSLYRVADKDRVITGVMDTSATAGTNANKVEIYIGETKVISLVTAHVANAGDYSNEDFIDTMEFVPAGVEVRALVAGAGAADRLFGIAFDDADDGVGELM